MVATADIGKVAAGLLQERWSGRRVIELEGPLVLHRNEIAATFGKLLIVSVRMEAVPARVLGGTLQVAGMKTPSTHFGCWTASTKAD